MLLPFVILCSCQQDELVIAPVNTETETVIENVTAYSRALDNVFDMMSEVYPEKYKALVSTKHLLKPEYYTTATLAMARPDAVKILSAKYETSDHEIPLDTLLYIVNFGNDEGFAVMLADTTQGNGIIALTERGSLSIADLTRDYSNETDNSVETVQKATMAGLIDNSIFTFVDRSKFSPYVDDPNAPKVGYIYGEWEFDKIKIEPLVKVKFDQGDPFNKYCPKFGNTTAPAGCVAIALLNIMSVHEYPSTINGYSGNWAEIINCNKAADKDYPKTEYMNFIFGDTLAHWTREIGRICKMSYGEKGSGAYITDAKSCLAKYNRYKNLKIKQDLSYNDINPMLEAGCPVYCQGFDTENHDKGHAWVLDGACSLKRMIYKRENVPYYYEYRTLVHCQYGWAGWCDGYYVLDCFNVSKGAVVGSETGNRPNRKNYNYYTEIITYTFK